MQIIRSVHTVGGATHACERPEDVANSDPLHERAVQVFAGDLAADRVRSVRAIRARLHVGQPRAQRVRAHLTALMND